MDNIFISGTNTEVGKTVVSAIVTEALEADYWKPIQSGELQHTDSMKVRSLISNTTTKIHPEAIRLLAPESPHYSASLEGRNISNLDIPFPDTSNKLVIEGAGGICVPLNEEEFYIDAIPKNTPILLVSKNVLGSINATLLSLYYLQNEGYTRIAMIFNGEAKPSTENIIFQKTKIPIIGRVEWSTELDSEFVKKESIKLKNNLLQFLNES